MLQIVSNDGRIILVLQAEIAANALERAGKNAQHRLIGAWNDGAREWWPGQSFIAKVQRLERILTLPLQTPKPTPLIPLPAVRF